MTRPTLFTTLLAVLLLAPVACAPAQDREREERDVAAFTGLAIEVAGTVHLRQGDAPSLEIEARPDVLSRLETTVDDGTLEIDVRDDGDWRWSDADVDVYVTMATVERIAILGSADVIAETPIEGGIVELVSAGSGNAELELSADEVNVRIVGSGTMRLSGASRSADVKILGSGDLEARDFEVESAEVQVMGSGDTELHVTGTLSARILGSGDVLYRGRPDIDSSVLGSGDVEPLG